MAREFALLVGIYLGQLEFTGVCLGQFRQHRHDRLAGRAPVGPEIHQYRLVEGFLQHQLLEILHADIVNIG